MTPRMRKLLLGALLLAGCNTGLEEAKAQRAALDRMLVEKTMLAEHRPQFERELLEIEALVTRLGPVTIEQVQAAVGPTRRVRVSSQNFYSEFTIAGSGGKAGVHEVLQGLSTLGEHLTVELIAWSPAGWKIVAVTPQIPEGPLTAPSTANAAPAGPCRGDCVEVRRVNAEVRARIAALRAPLGPLNHLHRRKREVQQVLRVRERFAHTALSDGMALMDASALPAGQVGFDKQGARLVGSAPSSGAPVPLDGGPGAIRK